MGDSLTQIALQLTRSFLPIIIVIGTTGNLLNIVLLTRPSLNRHGCSLYFLALSCNNLFYSSVVLIYRLIVIGYQVNLNTSSLAVCKFVQYINDVCPSMSPYFIVLASIDRYCASSSKAHLRKFSSVVVARWAIVMMVTIFMLFFINTAVVVDLRQSDRLGCRIRSDTVYNQVYIIVQVLLLTIIAPCLMISFGLMTIRNTKQVRVIPLAVSRYRRTERQLARMLLFQVGSHVVLTMPAAVTYLMLLLPTIFQITPTFYAIYSICYLPFYLSYATAFIVYVISGRIYRTELMRLIYKMLRLARRNRIEPTNRNTNTRTIPLTLRSVPTNNQQHSVETQL